MKTCFNKLLVLVFLSAATGCGVSTNGPSDRNSQESPGDSRQFGKIEMNDAFRAVLGAADITLYFFDVCQAAATDKCQEVSYIVDNHSQAVLTITNQPSLSPEINNHPPELEDIKSRYIAMNVPWPKPALRFEIEAERLSEKVLVANYIALKRCRVHPRWDEYVNLATSQRSALYLTVTSGKPENTNDDNRYPALGVLRVDVINGELSLKTNVPQLNEIGSAGQVLANVNLRDSDGNLVEDNLLISYEGFLFTCDAGFKVAPGTDESATVYGFRISSFLDENKSTNWLDVVSHRRQEIQDLLNYFDKSIEIDPRCSQISITDYERKFFPNLNKENCSSEKEVEK